MCKRKKKNFSNTDCDEKFSDKSGTDVGSTAQTLRDIVERVVEEAKRLPGLGSCDGSGRIQEERNGVENSYEEVLATTILNKVTEKYIRFSEANPSGKERGGGGGHLSLFSRGSGSGSRNSWNSLENRASG